MSVKIKISTTKAAERDEILKALHNFCLKNNCKIKKRRLQPNGEDRFITYVETEENTCVTGKEMV